MIRISGALSKEDLRDSGGLIGGRWDWLGELAESWRGVIMLLLLIWWTVSGLLGYTRPNWWGVGGVWAVIGSIGGWQIWKAKRDASIGLARFNANRPDVIILDGEGVRTQGPDGAATFRPWRHFSRWRERGRVVVLDLRSSDSAFLFSVASLSDEERQRLRDYLRSQICPGSEQDRARFAWKAGA